MKKSNNKIIDALSFIVSILFSAFRIIIGIIIYLILGTVLLVALPTRIGIVIDISILVITLTIIFFKIFRFEEHKRVVKYIKLGVVGLSIISISAATIRYKYLASIAFVDTTAVDVTEYMPFDNNSKISRLDEESTLKFTKLDKLPRVDGAAALFPLYSAFVNATYPENIYPLNHNDGSFFYTNTIYSYRQLAIGERDLVFGVDPRDRREELESFANANYKDFDFDDLEIVPMGKEALIFFVNINNPVNNITSEQIKGIYSNTITNWNEIGGENTKIKPLTRNIGSGSYTGLQKFMEDTPIVIPPNEKEELVFGGMGGIILAAGDDRNYPGAIGYSYYIYASTLKANNQIKLLNVDGVEVNNKTIRDSSYPITDEFYMVYNKKKVTKETLKLVDWVLSSQGQELVEKSGYAPIK